jgi:hypothetical protein
MVWQSQDLRKRVARNKGEESISGFLSQRFFVSPLFLCVSPESAAIVYPKW